MSGAWNDYCRGILLQAVPERGTEIVELLRRHDITFVPNEVKDGPSIRVHLATKTIETAIRPIERLWAYAYAHLLQYEAVTEAMSKCSDARSIDTSDPRFGLAMAVLKWAMKASPSAPGDGSSRSDNGTDDYPDSLAPPFAPSPNDTHHILATDLSQLVLAFIYLHEIGHIELGHAPHLPRHESIVQEREADAWAARFFLDHCIDYAREHGYDVERVREKRLLSLVMGHLWLMHAEVRFGVVEDSDHPPTYDRLPSILDQHGVEGGELPWAMACLGLDLYYQQQYGLTTEQVEFETQRDCYQYLADMLSRMPPRPRCS
jgi:hypothetical protein